MIPSSNTVQATVQLHTFDGANTSSHPIGATAESIPCTLTQVCLYFDKPVKTYADAGSILFADGVFVASQAGALSLLRGTVNGYLVDVP